MNIIIDKNSCILCEMCVFSCPFGSLKKNIDTIEVIDTDECEFCNECVDNCPMNSIEKEKDDF